MELPLIALLLSPVVLAVVWVVVGFLIGRLGGWHSLEARFPDRPGQAGRTLRYRSADLGQAGGRAIHLRKALHIDVQPDGIRLTPMRLMMPFSDPVFVPASVISAEKNGGRLGRTRLWLDPERTLRLDVAPSTAEQILGLLTAGGS